MPKFFQIQFSTLKTQSNIYGNVFYNTVELKQMQNQMIFFFLGKQCRFHVSSIVCKTWSRWTSIINISSMYCFTNIKSGLFDIREYDVTEFHRLINYRQEKKRIESHHIKESLWLQMHLQRSVSNPELVHFILDRKWLPYMDYGIFHIHAYLLFLWWKNRVFCFAHKTTVSYCTMHYLKYQCADTIQQQSEIVWYWWRILRTLGYECSGWNTVFRVSLSW